MPETPDFEAIALTIVDVPFTVEPRAPADAVQQIAEQLRLMWNARGAADTARIEHDLSSMMGATAAGPYLKNLDRSLRTLDR